MPIEFHKMHGAGNDFVLLDMRGQTRPPDMRAAGAPDAVRYAASNAASDAAPKSAPKSALNAALNAVAERARDTGGALLARDAIVTLCDRHRGIGCDQLVILRDPEVAGADVSVAFFNPDGSEAGACGNASRCVALYDARRTGAARIVLHTRAGLLPAEIHADGRVTVDMGPPRLDWRSVPLARACDTLALDLPHRPAACSMGNPHATLVFGPDDAMPDPAVLGPALERDPLFPERANIGFARMLAPDRMRLRVWERGAGLTLACGSGACAAVVNAARQARAARACTVEVDGGTLSIDWRPPANPGEEGHVLMTGPATFVFSGEIADGLL